MLVAKGTCCQVTYARNENHMALQRYFEVQAKFDHLVQARQFLLRCDAVAGLYERHFAGRVTTKSARKIIVFLKAVRTPDHLKELGVVLSVEILGDYGQFLQLSDREQQTMALGWLHNGCLEAATHFGWPPDPFEKARAAVLEKEFVNEWVHRHKAFQRKNKLRAELHCTHDLHEFRADVVVFQGSRELCRVTAFRTEPDRMIFSWNLGEMKWISDTCVELQGVRGAAPNRIELSRYLDVLS